MSAKSKLAYSIIIFIVSAVIMLAWGGFSSEAFLIDDNRTQWFPVIEKTYEHFFEHGQIPTYNFYLLKGLAISEPGYYATFNPLMFICYIISHYTFLPFSTLTIYTCILFGLGNVAMFALSRRFKCSTALSIMIVAAYSACGAFIGFSYWYYVFNNYLFVPLIIYTVLKSEGTKFGYFACGILLALEILMGNVQYTCYHYMMYCIIGVFVIIFRPGYIKVLLSNIFVGLTLSAPSLLSLLNASSGGFEGKNSFLRMAADPLTVLFNSIIPGSVLEMLGVELPLPNNYIMGRTDRMLFYTASISVPVLICLFSFVLNTLKNDKSDQIKDIGTALKVFKSKLKEVYKSYKEKKLTEIIPIGVFVSALFFYFFVTRGFVAYILNYIPVINNFRYLFKAFFVFVPLLAVIAAVIIPKGSLKARKIAGIVCIVLTVVGFVNNYCSVLLLENTFESTDNMTYAEEVDYAESIIEEKGLDLKNYRSFAIYQSNMHNPEKFDYSHALTRNFPAYIESFSLVAYEISSDLERLKSMDMLVDTDNEQSFSVYSNAGTMSYFYHNLLENHTETIYQLSENSIKYLILEKPTDENQGRDEIKENIDYIKEITDLFERSGLIELERTEDFGEGYTLLVLGGVDSLCTSGNNKSIALSDERMDLLSFEPDGSDSYKLAFAYDKNVIAYQLGNDGSRILLETKEDNRGNIIITGADSNSKVYLGYSNQINTLGLLSEIVITAASIVVIVLLILRKENTEQQRKLS